MTVLRLMLREIAHRKLNFATSVLSVFVAVGSACGLVLVLERHDANTETAAEAVRARTEKRLAALRADVDANVAVLNDEMRKAMKLLGFNLYILPADQNMTDFFSEGYAAKLMPESYVTVLSESGMMEIRHLLPILERKVTWPEEGDRTMVLVGTRGEVPFTHRAPKEPMQDPVSRGSIVLGYELWRGAGAEVGSSLRLMGRDFTVAECYGERGTRDDITAWVSLAEAQEMLALPGQISAIFALQCVCAGEDLPKVKAAIAAALPDTQVRQVHTKALAREVARAKAAEQGRLAIARTQQEAEEALAQEAAHRAAMRRDLERLARLVIPVVALGSAVWLSALSWTNVQSRRTEVGVLSAVGVRSGRIASLFLGRAALAGLVGGPLGYVAGRLVASRVGEAAVEGAGAGGLNVPLLILAIVGAPLLCVAVSAAPARSAARRDPAEALREV